MCNVVRSGGAITAQVYSSAHSFSPSVHQDGTSVLRIYKHARSRRRCNPLFQSAPPAICKLLLNLRYLSEQVRSAALAIACWDANEGR